MEKKCSGCGRTKNLELFHKETKGKFGRKSKCAECCTFASREWKRDNNEQEKANRRYWNRNNKQRHNESTYRWREENKDRHLTYVANWQRTKKKSNPEYKLLASVRSLVSNHFARRSMCKTKDLENMLEISWFDFKKHIISMFEENMTEDNYGSYWSLDHICPCAVAQNEEEMIKLQHWSNWRPMKHRDNLSKGDKITEEGRLLCLNLLGREPSRDMSPCYKLS